MDTNKIEKLKKLLEVANDGLSKNDFVESFKKILQQVFRIETQVLERINKAIDEMKTEQGNLKGATQGDLETLKSRLLSEAEKMFEEQRQSLNFIRDKVRNMREGTDGYTPIKGVDYFDGEKGAPGEDADPQKIIDEVLKKIPDYDEIIEDLKKQIKEFGKQRGVGGVGFSRIHLKLAGGVTGTGTSEITVATTAPSNPATGDLWVDSS